MILSQLGANVYDILKYKKLIITEAAVKNLRRDYLELKQN